jgi:hypothetical protein
MNHIQDSKIINYLKNLLDAAVKRCAQENITSPQLYAGYVKLIAKEQNEKDPSKPEVEVGLMPIDVGRGKQKKTVEELVLSVGDKSITSYFVAKNSAAQGEKLTAHELTAYRPDVAAERIANYLTDPQAYPLESTKNIPQKTNVKEVPDIVPVELPITTTNTQNSPAAVVTAAEKLLQDMGINSTQTSQTPTNPVSQTTQNTITGLGDELLSNLETPVNKTTTPISPIPPATDPQKAEAISSTPDIATPQTENSFSPPKTNTKKINQLTKIIRNNVSPTLDATSDAMKQIGAQQGYNSMTLMGDVIHIASNFIKGVEGGIQEERLNQMRNKMNVVALEEKNLKVLMQTVSASYDAAVSLQNSSVPTPVITVPEPNEEIPVEPSVTTSTPTEPNFETQPEIATPVPVVEEILSEVESIATETKVELNSAKKEQTPIDKLLASTASIEEKLKAIEETLDKQLEEILAAKKLLQTMNEKIQEYITLHSQASPAPENASETVTENVDRQPAPEVIQTEKPQLSTELNEDLWADTSRVEVQNSQGNLDLDEEFRAIDEIDESQLDELLIDSLLSTDTRSVNPLLASENLAIAVSEDGSEVSIKEISNGLVSKIFSANLTDEGWEVNSEISPDYKIELIEQINEAAEKAIELPSQQTVVESVSDKKEELELAM